MSTVTFQGEIYTSTSVKRSRSLKNGEITTMV